MPATFAATCSSYLQSTAAWIDAASYPLIITWIITTSHIILVIWVVSAKHNVHPWSVESQEKEGGDDQDNLEKVGAFAKQSTGVFVSPSGRSLAASVAVSVSQHCRLNIQTSNITDLAPMHYGASPFEIWN